MSEITSKVALIQAQLQKDRQLNDAVLQEWMRTFWIHFSHPHVSNPHTERTISAYQLDSLMAAIRRDERERCVKMCEDRAIHQNGPHIVTLEMNQMARALKGEHDFRG